MLHVPTPEELERARNTLRGVVGASPLLPFGTTGGGDRSRRVLLKLENLQPTGSYKLRGATCAVAALTDAQLEEGVLTASAGLIIFATSSVTLSRCSGRTWASSFSRRARSP